MNHEDDQDDRLQREQALLEVFAQLDEITRDLPPVDAVKIARESREELERRSDFLFQWIMDKKDEQ